MKYYLLILIMSTLVVFGCKAKRGAVSDRDVDFSAETVTENKEQPSQKDVFVNISENDSLFASIEKGACFGSCPTYSMSIYNNGSVVLKAIRGVNKTGVYHSSLSNEQMKAFLLRAKEIGYVEMKDVYDSKSVTDLPSVTTTVVINGSRKSVRRRYEYPKEIIELEKLFDNLLDSLTWEKVQQTNN